MKLMNRNGYFRGPIVEHGVSTTQSGLPQWVALLKATEEYDFTTCEWRPFTDENCDVTAFLCLFSQKSEPTFHVQNIMHAVEWDGRSLVGLAGMDLVDAGIQFAVSMETYNGNTNPKVQRVAAFDDVPQAGSVRRLDDKELKSVASQFDALLKKAAGPAKAVSAPSAPQEKPAALPPKPKASKKAAAPVAPPVEDDPPFEETADLPVDDEPDAAAVAAAAEPESAPAAVPGPKAKAKKGLTKDEAWAHCIQMKAKNVTNDEVTKSWRIAVKNIGKPEAKFTPQDWDTVAENVMAEHGVF